MFKRILDVSEILKRKSLFLFGPRQTGKSTFLRQQFPEALYINLLKNSEYQNILKTHDYLSNLILYYLSTSKKISKLQIVIIDEVQKHPAILDDVHDLIEKHKNLRFILTGSSARKLKRNGANLLGGRASWIEFFPLCYSELGEDKIELWLSGLTKGKLPPFIQSEASYLELKDYIGLYLKEEIQAESLTRSIENFSRFLDIAGLSNTEQINYTSIASDAQISPKLAKDYFSILTDTLIGHLLHPFQTSLKRKSVSASKFYLFDCGVSAALTGRKEIAIGTPEYGKQLEQAVFLEIKTYLSYTRSEKKLEYWRSLSKFEIDFLVYENIKQIVAIEVKASSHPSPKDFKGFKAFEEEIPLFKKIIVCHASHPQITNDQIEILPIELFLKKLWSNELF